MMGKIAIASPKKVGETKKKKGRPSRSDHAPRHHHIRPESDKSRRSHRRKDSESQDEERENKREKKIKLVLKLSPLSHSHNQTSSSSSEEEFENGSKPLKKRKIDGDDDVDGSDDDGSVKGRERNGIPTKERDFVPGTRSGSLSIATPLPDRKLLELILHKLQKKDTYGVYAEPVDPKELPDYHEIIEQPMDFSTIRKKLATGAYSSLEQFESDVFLVCTNAMRYNAPETIYFKQARSIQDLAKKKFEKLRVDGVGTEVDPKCLQEMRSISVSKSIKKSLCGTIQEPVGSDFSSGATLATKGDACTRSNPTQVSVCEKPSNDEGPVDGNSFLTENKLEKAEELSVKGFPSKFGKKLSVPDENRRATYNVSNQPVTRPELVFATFETEKKQLVSVGLHADHSYGRSLARFAATLGPVAWRVASKRIEQALPAGYKFGRGWIGEYEPLPTPVLFPFENHAKMHPDCNAHLQFNAELKKNDENGEKWKAVQDGRPNNMKLDVKTQTLETASSRKADTLKAVNGMYQQQKNSLTIDFAKPGSTVLKEVKPLLEMVSRNKNPVCSVPFKQSEVVAPHAKHHASQSGNGRVDMEGAVVTGGLPNGNSMSHSNSSRVGITSLDFVSNHQTGGPSYFPRVNEQGLDDPVNLKRIFAGNFPNQPKYSNSSTLGSTQVMPSVPSSRRDDPNAAATAARIWMSIGAAAHPVNPKDISGIPEMQISAASLYNPTRDLPPKVSLFRENAPGTGTLQSEKNRSAPQPLPQPVHVVGGEPLFRDTRPMVFPVATDLSRFQLQSPWQGLVSHTQQRQKTDTRPPDLNIVFQPPGSPVQQPSGILLDSQQPDLALQL
ncbi:uncharacterized protein LOC143884135 [Tasmannia lanceolata]|uniref:uncharacterized protein LOC143884135 n=1 Tax=Tasmannia lanceolata TaxID=3420 RepID=UPI004064A3F9